MRYCRIGFSIIDYTVRQMFTFFEYSFSTYLLLLITNSYFKVYMFARKRFATLPRRKFDLANVLLLDNKGAEGGEAAEQTVQQDWSVVWNYFDDPYQLLTTPGALPKGMQEMVRNAVSEMRRYYSRKVVDVLIKVTRVSLDSIRKRFIRELDSGNSLRQQNFRSLSPVLI